MLKVVDSCTSLATRLHILWAAANIRTASLQRQTVSLDKDASMDEREALEQSLIQPWELAEYFGVPKEIVCFLVPLSL